MYRQKSPVMLRLLKADLCQGAITLLGLPDAALSNIVAFLPVEDVVRLSSANHSMQEIDNDDEIWRGRVADDFLCTKSAGLKAQGRTWKDDYIKMYVTHKSKVRDAKVKRQKEEVRSQIQLGNQRADRLPILRLFPRQAIGRISQADFRLIVVSIRTILAASCLLIGYAMSTTLLEIATDVCFWWLWWIPRAAHVLLWGAVILFAFNSDDNVGGRLQWIFRNNRVKASILLCAALAIEWWVQPSVAVLIIRLLLKLLSVQGIAAAVTMVFVTGMTHSSTRNPFVSLGLGGAVSACMFQAIRLLRFDWHPALLYILVVVQRIAMLGGFGGAAGVGIVANICNLYHRRRLELVPVFWACALGVTAFGFECLYSYLEVPSFDAFTLTQRLVTFSQAVLLVCDTIACVFYPFFVGSFASLFVSSLPWAEQVRQDHTFRSFMRNMFIILTVLICCCQAMLASQHVPRNLVWDTVYNITTAPMFVSA